MMDMMDLKEFGALVQRLIEKRDLSRQETYRMFTEVLLNRQPDLQQGAFLAALVAKGETAEEIAGAWDAITELDTVSLPAAGAEPLFENSGTGMDRLKTFNVSSAAAVIAAACGVKMARHGARAITSCCGTVDLLERVGIDVECRAETVLASISAAGIGLFNGMSPQVHPAALGRILSQIRFGSTLNLAGSLASPVRPKAGLRGVHSARLLAVAAEAMQAVGYERGLAVYGRDDASGLGMDELSLSGETIAYRFHGQDRETFTIAPEEAGLRRVPFAEVASLGDPEREAGRFLKVLAGQGSPACTDFSCLNAGAILHTAGRCDTLKQGVEQSREAVASGKAIDKLRQWAASQDDTGGTGSARLEALLARV